MSFDRETYQRERIRALDRRVTMLAAEERRLYRLLGLALRVATREGQDCEPGALLEVLCALDGTNPARGAWVEEKQRRDAIDADLAAGERFLAALRDTDPAHDAAGRAAA